MTDRLALIVVVGLASLAPLYDWTVLRGRPAGWGRFLAILPSAAVAAALPFVIPPEERFARFVVSLVALVIVAKVVELARGRVHDPAMTRSFWRYLFWRGFAADSRWPVDAEAAARARREGGRRLGRFLTKVAGIGALLAIATAAPRLLEPWPALMLWNLFFGWFLMSGVADSVSGLGMLSGIHLAEMFKAPPLARSPLDFWSHRWNLIFKTWAYRNVFLPAGGLRRPLRGMLWVFAMSAIVHEYIVFASVGRTEGHMTAFFALHGAATILTAAVARKRRNRPLLPRAVAVPLHLGWFTLTAPFFFTPVFEIVTFHGVRLW